MGKGGGCECASGLKIYIGKRASACKQCRGSLFEKMTSFNVCCCCLLRKINDDSQVSAFRISQKQRSRKYIPCTGRALFFHLICWIMLRSARLKNRCTARPLCNHQQRHLLRNGFNQPPIARHIRLAHGHDVGLCQCCPINRRLGRDKLIGIPLPHPALRAGAGDGVRLRSKKVEKIKADLIADRAEEDGLGHWPMLGEVGGREQSGPAMQVLDALAIGLVDILKDSGRCRRHYMEVKPLELRSELKIRAKGSEDIGRVAEAVGKETCVGGSTAGRKTAGNYIMADVAYDKGMVNAQ